MSAWDLHNSSGKCFHLPWTNISVNVQQPMRRLAFEVNQLIRDQVCSEKKAQKEREKEKERERVREMPILGLIFS
jgi:hypothetical protein